MRKQVLIITSVVLASFLIGTMFSTNYLATGGKPNPVWDAIYDLQAKVNSLNTTVIEQEAQIAELQSQLDSMNSMLTARIEDLELNQSALAERMTALEDQHKPPEEVTILYDRFDTGLDGWSYWGDSGYVLEWVSNTAKISGNGYVVDCGMQKIVDLSEWDGSGQLLLSFDWRATSDTTSGGATGAILWIQDADTDVSRIWASLIEGGTTDTGWRHYVDDISTYVIGHPRIRIILYIHDGWIADWHQTNAYDNIKLASTVP